MAIQYHIYSNDQAGGPVDYSTPVGTTALTTFVSPPLPAGASVTFAVRAFDSANGLEEENADARVQIVLDATGQDISARPGPPAGVTVTPLAGGGLRVHWLPCPATQAAKPTGFHVYMGSPAVDYATPAATVAANGSRDYRADLTGLTGGTTYLVAVRAFNAAGEETNAFTVPARAKSTGPDPVDELVATPVFQAQ